MSLHLLWTSADSLIAALALSFILRGWHALPLALMFGLCDGLGSALGVSLPLAGGLAAMLAGLGFACGAVVLSWWRAGLRDARPLAAACLIAAGSLLAWGA